MKIGTNIKKLRIAQGLTQDQLAEKLYVTRQTVSSWERSASNPNLEQLEAVAAALGVDIMALLYGPQPQYRPTARRVIVTLALVGAAVAATALGYGMLHDWLRHYAMRAVWGCYVFLMFCFGPFLGLLWGLGAGALGSLRWRLALPRQKKWACLAGAVAALAVNPLLYAGGKLISWHMMKFWATAHEGVGLLTGLVAGVLLYLAWNPDERGKESGKRPAERTAGR